MIGNANIGRNFLLHVVDEYPKIGMNVEVLAHVFETGESDLSWSFHDNWVIIIIIVIVINNNWIGACSEKKRR